MADFSVQQALSKTFFEALHSYHQGGLTNGGGIAGIQRPNLDRFDANGQIVADSDPLLQPSRADWKSPFTMTTWTQKPDGTWNRPTFKTPETDAKLDAWLQGLADKLAALPGQTYMVPSYLQGQIDQGDVAKAEQAFAKENYASDPKDESPQLQEIRDQLRGEIARAAASRVQTETGDYTRQVLSFIQNDKNKGLVTQALKDSQSNQDGGQAQFFTAPSSSSGKFHPADEINTGGLALHSLRDVVMGDRLCQIFNVTGLERDEILGSLALHDIEKGGMPWTGYAGDHGPLGQQYLQHIWGVNPMDPDDIEHPEAHMSTLVGRHMAQWNTAPLPPGKKYPGKAPLVPRNIDEQIVSWADYLGALDNVYVDTPK
ncbi:MAG: hypothetical protein ACYCW6_05960 [Candidatus Xenobia bacterium]